MTCWNLIQQMWPSDLSFMSILSKLKAWTGQRQQSNLDQDAKDQHHQLPRSVTSFCITCPMLNNLFSYIVSILLRTVLFFSILQSFVSWVSKHVLLMLSYYRTKFSPNDSFIANIYSDLIAILLWAGTSRPIIWNKNLRSLCVFQLLFFLHTCHMLSIPQSLYDLSIDITSFHFFDTPLNLTISFVYIFSRGFTYILCKE